MDNIKNNTNKLTNHHLKQLVIKTCQQLWLMIIMAVISTTAAATTTISYYHNDHLGTPQVLTDEDQNVVWQAEYDPFGKATVTTETVTNNIRFPGQYFDQETSLHYNYFRTYDPNTGRYITSDPIGLSGGVNTYGYVGGNPYSYTDPSGLNAVIYYPGRIGWSIGAGISRSPWGRRVTLRAVDVAWDVLNNDATEDDSEESCGAQDVPDLTGKGRSEVEDILGEHGFEPGDGIGNYDDFVHGDGSRIWIRPSGEIGRQGPLRPRRDNPTSKPVRDRFNQNGDNIPFNPDGGSTHGTGEIIIQ